MKSDTKVGNEIFFPGNTKYHLRNWEKITSDPFILQLSQGIPLEFINNPPVQERLPREYKFNEQDCLAISKEVTKLVIN